MPRSISTLRQMEETRHAYVLLLDGIPIAFTSDTSGELTFTGGLGYIERAEDDTGEPGGRVMREGLIVPETIELGGTASPIGLDPTSVSFSILLDPSTDTADYFALGGEEPTEMLGRLAPTDDPAPPSVVGVTVRDRYVGIERVGPSGERRMFPFLLGETLQGYDHHGDTDGATVPAIVSQRPLVHEGRPVALYRVYRDPSATSSAGSLAWPSLSNYRPIWVGKMRDSGTWTAGRRITIECTGFESLLERNMATGAAAPFGVLPEFTAQAGIDDQVAIYCGTGYVHDNTGIITAAETYQGRDWTTLAGSHKTEIQDSLRDLLADTIAGVDTDYETGEAEFDADGSSATMTAGGSIQVQTPEAGESGDLSYKVIHIAMHRRRWLALGFDPVQQAVSDGSVVSTSFPISDQKAIVFRPLTSGESFEPFPNRTMGPVPGPGYYMGEFHTIALGATSFVDSRSAWDNGGAPRQFDPLFPNAEAVNIIQSFGGQVVRLSSNPVLLPQTHLPIEGQIDGTDCDSVGMFLIKGKIRRADGSIDDGSIIVSDDTEQAVVARCSWIAYDELFADIGDGVEPALYIIQLYDPRRFGYPYRPLDRDWASLELQCVQLHSYNIGTAAGLIERSDQTLSCFLRSTGTSTGPNGSGVIQQGDNSGTAIGFFGDILSAGMGLGVPDDLLPSQTEITSVMTDIPGGPSGDLVLGRIAYEGTFPSYDTLRALLEPRAVRVGFHGARFQLYRLRDASPAEAHVAILESDLYGTLGDPTTVYPAQQSRALAPVDVWRVSFASDQTHEIKANDPSAGVRRGDSRRDIQGRGLIASELYGDDPDALPGGGHWRVDARQLFGEDEARFLARRHGMVTVSVSRPKGQDIYPGTLVLLSNPWVYSADGTQSVSSVVGRVVRAVHHTSSGHCVADILVFEGQWRPPPHFAPMVWISRVSTSTSIVIDDSGELPSSSLQLSGWTRPAWATGGGGNAIVSLIRQLPTGAWVVVGTAEFGSSDGTTITLATALTALPPDSARTMAIVPAVMASQPEWFRDIYSAVGVQGDNTRVRRFV